MGQRNAPKKKKTLEFWYRGSWRAASIRSRRDPLLLRLVMIVRRGRRSRSGGFVAAASQTNARSRLLLARDVRNYEGWA